MRVSDWSSDVCSSDLARPTAVMTARAAVSDPAVPTMMLLYAIRPPRPSTRCPAGRYRPPAASDAVRAVEVLLVGQLAGVLYEEARLAHELTGTLGEDATTGLGAAVVRLGSLFLLVFLLFLGSGDAVLQDGVEVGDRKSTR